MKQSTNQVVNFTYRSSSTIKGDSKSITFSVGAPLTEVWTEVMDGQYGVFLKGNDNNWYLSRLLDHNGLTITNKNVNVSTSLKSAFADYVSKLGVIS